MIYTLHRIVKEQKLKTKKGVPIKSPKSARRKLRQHGFKKTKKDNKGNLIYALTEQDIKKMNTYETK